MTDPFEALREPARPVAPDPRFAARLRARLERALLAPEGATMTTTTTATEMPLRSLTPYLTVDDGRRALEWYVRALGARSRGEPIVMDDDRIGHAELAFGDSVLMLADEFAELGLLAPKARGGVSQSLRLEVADVDGTVRRAVELGARLERPVADQGYGRNGVIVDPFGHRWLVSAQTAATPARPEQLVRLRHGDVVYSSLWAPDVERAAAFFGAVLGWRYVQVGEPRAREVEGLGHRLGLWGGEEHGTMLLCFAVDDMAVAVERVRAAGGRADEPTREPHGLIANCVDDQGMPFALYELVPGEEAPGVPARSRHGEICYLTIEVPDSARFRAFYGAVLGWEFVPGQAEDGWSARNRGEEVHFMTGMQGGHARSTVVPMFVVDDIVSAVERVRAAGGTATEPDRKPYGVMAECADDQGTRFYLGELS
ncbi:MAG TPA: VOC family protein [Streptosporangiaceae bacterium]|nr:VOC family protein [Streptosporangiaceae bacterium]